MAEKSWLQRCGLTPVKGGLIVVLSIALVAIAWGQFSGTDTEAKTAAGKSTPGKSTSASRPSVTRSAARPNKLAVAVEVPTRPVQLRPWPRLSVEQVVRFNPLRLPASLEVVPQETSQAERSDLVEERNQQLVREEHRRTLQEQGIRMIVVGPHGKSAYLGAQLIHEGDVVEGFIVKEIGPTGVELVEPQAP